MAGTTSAQGSGFTQTDVFKQQSPFLQDLYSQGRQLYQQQAPQTAATQDQLRGILEQIAGISTGTPEAAGQFAENLISGDTRGQQTLLDLMNPEGNPYLDQMVSSATRGVTQNFQENVLPGISGGATSAGQYGGSRQGIAQGVASGRYLDTIGDIETTLRGGQYQSDMNRALSAAGQYTGGQQAGAGILSSLSGQNFNQQMQQLSTLLGGYAQLPQVPWAPLTAYANTVGAPALLQSGVNTSSSGGFNIL